MVNEQEHERTSNHIRVLEEVEEDELAEDEVIISSNNDGELTPRASQVTDYRLRSTVFKNLTLWDFIAQIDKVKRISRKKKENVCSNSDSEDDSDSERENIAPEK